MKIYIWIIIMISSLNSFATTMFSLDLPETYRSQEKLVLAELTKLEQLLPPTMRGELGGSVQIVFKKLSMAFEAPHCQNEAKTNKSVYGLGLKILKLHSKIYIHEGFLDLVLSPNEKWNFSCGHKTGKKLFAATVIHELTHLYDGKTKLSHSPAFRSFSGQKNKFGTKLKTFLNLKKYKNQRTVDAYELVNNKEYFAVNMEYFLLDKKYKCARPATYGFLGDTFRYYPESDSECDKSVFPLAVHDLRGPPKIQTINVNQVYSIDYLIAGEAKSIESRFGHSMIRLVICENGKPLNAECIKETKNHLVISYAADLENKSINNLKGFFGGYTTRGSVLKYLDVLDTYNYGEERKIEIYPLKLTDKEKGSLIKKLIEESWGYYGDYRFLTNNCATETARVLSSKKKSFPRKLLNDLLDSDSIDQDQVVIIPSRASSKDLIWNELNSLRPNFKEEGLSLDQSDWDEILNNISNMSEEERLKKGASIITWISWANSNLTQGLWDKFSHKYNKELSNKSLGFKVVFLNKESYGIPDSNEVMIAKGVNEVEVAKLYNEFSEAQKEIKSKLKILTYVRERVLKDII